MTAEAKLHLAELVLAAAAKERNGIGDSDRGDEQPVIVEIDTTLGELRAAGLREMPGYYPEGDVLRFGEGTRVRRINVSEWTGVVWKIDRDSDWPYRVQWDNGQVEDCTGAELQGLTNA